MNNTKEVLDAQEWQHSARHVVWLDTDLLTGDGMIELVAPDCFFLAADGLEYVRFGKVRSLQGGSEAALPVPESLLPKVIEAAEEHPGECVFIEELSEDQTSEQAWKAFFAHATQEVQKSLNYMKDWFFPSSADLHIQESGGGITDDLLSHQSKMALDCRYMASLLDPSPEATTMIPTDYDAFDMLSYLNLPGNEDIDGRVRTADKLRSLRTDDGAYARGEVAELRALLAETYSFFELPEA